MNAEPGSHWVFGYGSLIYKVDFPYQRRERASIEGWQRRFWQGSHDHRGTPASPGRVVTLVPAAQQRCRGVAYLVDQAVFEHLDYREKNGYQRQDITLELSPSGELVAGTVYVAAQGNPAFLGPAPLSELVAQIASSEGPSGRNIDYVLELAQSLQALGEVDAHVEVLASALLAFTPESTATIG